LKYKGRTDIAARIIEIADLMNGGLPTMIMYSVRLGWEETISYLNILTENSLLSYTVDTQRYYATEKGLKFLQLYNDVGVLFKRIAMA
jgi:predicted transcriptional regulator